MKVLVVAPWLPYPPHSWGAAMRCYEILRVLAERHDVNLLAYAGADQAASAAALEEMGIGVTTVDVPPMEGHKRLAQAGSLLTTTSFEVLRVRSRKMQAAIDAAASALNPDVILVECSQMACFQFPATAALIVDEQNIEFELHRRLIAFEPGLARKAFNWMEAVKLRREERRTWDRASACLVTSHREKAIVEAMSPHTFVEVIPNGVDIDYYSNPGVKAIDSSAIVYTGRMSYRPNADAAAHFVRDILPTVLRSRPDAIFYVVGSDPPAEVRALAGSNVVITGSVDDVRPYLYRAGVVIAPIRAGSGTRLKILEALAAGKGVVSTALGCEGLDLQAGTDLLVADSPERFAAEVVRLLDDPGFSAILGARGADRVARSYGWGTVMAKLPEVLTAVASRHRAGVTAPDRDQPSRPAGALHR
jgi:glycosyltransferase involved in cell wall biosynthesis